MIKQHCTFYKNFNLKECWETNHKGKKIYWIKFSYHKLKNNKGHAVKQIEDSNGWVRVYYKNGNLKEEIGNPDDYNIEDIGLIPTPIFRRFPFIEDWDFHYMSF